MRALVAILILGVLSAPVAADKGAAKQHYQRGTMLFDLQRYGEAAVEYEKAFESWDNAALLYNIGQAYRLAGNLKKSVAAYRAFLRRVPNTPNRAEVETRIAALQQKLDEPATTTPAVTKAIEPIETPTPTVTPTKTATTATAPRSQPHARTFKWAGVGLLAGGAALLGTGAAFAALAQSASNDLTHAAPGTVFAPETERRFQLDRAVGVSLLAIGGACAIGGAALFAIGFRGERAR